MDVDLFGNEISEKSNLREKFGENPFSVLDARSGNWINRKRKWISLGIRSEIGRENVKCSNLKSWTDDKRSRGKLSGNTLPSNASIFDPVLCELIYNWFCKENGTILDPFAGGSVRGLVASVLGHSYTGIDIRKEQVDSNVLQAESIGESNARWICGDSNIILDGMEDNSFDLLFSCPPYANLEKYSDLDGDISNLDYPAFLKAYRSIIDKSCRKLKDGGFACFVVGEVRDKKGNYYGFVPDTVRAFTDCGMSYYNECVLLTSLAGAAIRAAGNMRNRKMVKVHQNVLIFKK